MKTSENREHGRLPRRPEAVGYNVERIVQDAIDGKIRIPKFQRPLRWQPKDVIDFFDSIRRGFPIGELLLSRREAPASEICFGTVRIETPASTAALWVVDGQQRITALVATLQREEPKPAKDNWAIWYDLEKESFHRLTEREPQPAWIPLNVVLDSKKLLNWIRNWPFSTEREDLVDEALELGKSIREYQIPAYIVDGADEAALRLIFTRSNNSGAPMRDSEVFDALYQSEGESPIKSAIARLADLGFGKIDEEVFLRCIRLANNLDERISLEGLSKSLKRDAVQLTEVSLRRAISTLMAAGIPHVKLLPYRLGLLVLVKLFSRFPDDDHFVNRLAGIWLWRGMLTAELEHSNHANVNRAVVTIDAAQNAEGALLELINGLPDFEAGRDVSLKRDPRTEFGRSVSTQRAAVRILLIMMYDHVRRNSDTWLQRVAQDFDLDPLMITLDNERPYESLTGPGGKVEDIVVQLTDVPPLTFATTFPEICCLDERCLGSLHEDVDQFREYRREILGDFIDDGLRERLGSSADLRPKITTIIAGAVKGKER
ncbi:MAG: DUF262 domain-containing protein [Pirellulales bacterium]|nr:DUF262 domain-containing protein [Pirellulales bacterium]